MSLAPQYNLCSNNQAGGLLYITHLPGAKANILQALLSRGYTAAHGGPVVRGISPPRTGAPGLHSMADLKKWPSWHCL